MEEKNVFEMECGQVLHLQPVSAQVLKSLTSAMFTRILADPEKAERLIELAQSKEEGEEFRDEELLSVFGAEVGAMAEAGEKLFVYCAGWGVKDDPPRRGVDEELLKLLGVERGSAHRRRAEWIRTMLADDKEANALIGAVQRLTLGG